MSKKILIAGVGGVLGKELVGSFLRKGIQPGGIALFEREFNGLDGKLSFKRCADVTKPETLQGCCEGFEIVVSVIGITRIRGSLTHMDVDYQGNMNLLAEAQCAGVKKFVFISPAGTELGAKQGVPLMQAKFKFEEALKQSGIEWVIIRAGGFMRDFAEMSKLALKGPMYIIGNGKVVSTPIDVRELADLMVDDTLQASNKYTSIGGPQDMAWNQICDSCFKVWGKPVKIVSMPVWACTAVLSIVRFFSAEFYALGKLLVFFSVNSVPTEKRGKVSFDDYLKKYFEKNNANH